MSKIVVNPEIDLADNIKPEEIIKGKDYSSLVIGAKPLFDIIKDYYKDEKRRILALEIIDDITVNVYFG